MTVAPSTMHQVIGLDGKPHPATGCFNPWIGSGSDVFAMPRDGNKIEPLLSGKEYFKDLISSINAATQEVLILGWQVNWDAMLAPGIRLYDVIYKNAERGIKFYVMPWDDTNPIQTYDDQTQVILEDINQRLGLRGNKKRVHVMLSGSFASTNNSYFSHHQKCVVVDRQIGYMGGIDLCYGRYDDATYTLHANADKRNVLNRYNPGIAWMKALSESDVVDPDLMSGLSDTARPSLEDMPASVDPNDLKSTAEIISDRVYAGGWQAPYAANAPVLNNRRTDRNVLNLHTLDEARQPRMPWQDAHSRIEGPVVSDLVRNFVVRWNIGSSVKLALPESPNNYPTPGKAKIQFLRSAPANMRQEEYIAAKAAFASAPSGTDDSIQKGMIRLIENAAYFIYIESQFFVSDFGKIGGPQGTLSPAGQYIKESPSGIGNASLNIMRAWDDQNAREMDRPPQNKVCEALVQRIQDAILNVTNPPFHVYITLPVHPEGALIDATIAVQVYWTMQTLVFGSNSLLNGIRRGLKAREIMDKTKTCVPVSTDPNDKSHEDIPLEACFKYVTLLNLRNWEKLGEQYVTEQIYIHSKLMVVDDRFAIIGSANINDRSLLGERDSEIAMLVIDTDTELCDIGLGRATPTRGFARKLRVGIWEKIFGIAGNVRPAGNLAIAIEQPANPESWKSIQKQAQANAEAYEKAFPFVPKSWSAKIDQDKKPLPASILPTWDDSELAPPKSKWGKKGNISSPLPCQENFWGAPQYNKDGIGGLASIKGFITALPIHWTRNENLKIPFPTSLVVQNDRWPTGIEGIDKTTVLTRNEESEKETST